jgi:hypothetical protein
LILRQKLFISSSRHPFLALPTLPFAGIKVGNESSFPKLISAMTHLSLPVKACATDAGHGHIKSFRITRGHFYFTATSNQVTIVKSA